MNQSTKYIMDHADDYVVHAGMVAAYSRTEQAIADEVRRKRVSSSRLLKTDWKRRFQDGRLDKGVATAPWFTEYYVPRIAEPRPHQVNWNGPAGMLYRLHNEMWNIEIWLLGFTVKEFPAEHKKLRAEALTAKLAELETMSVKLQKIAAHAPKSNAKEIALIRGIEADARVLAQEALELIKAPAPEPMPEPEKHVRQLAILDEDWRPNF